LTVVSSNYLTEPNDQVLSSLIVNRSSELVLNDVINASTGATLIPAHNSNVNIFLVNLAIIFPKN